MKEILALVIFWYLMLSAMVVLTGFYYWGVK